MCTDTYFSKRLIKLINITSSCNSSWTHFYVVFYLISGKTLLFTLPNDLLKIYECLIPFIPFYFTARDTRALTSDRITY